MSSVYIRRRGTFYILLPTDDINKWKKLVKAHCDESETELKSLNILLFLNNSLNIPRFPRLDSNMKIGFLYVLCVDLFLNKSK